MRLLAPLATFAAGCALALVVAYWGWQIVAPAPLHVAARAPADPVTAILASDLFGANSPTTDPADPQSTLPADARLLGVIAEPSQHGYALFRLPGGVKLVTQGQDVVPGVALVSIEPLAVTIRERGRERRLALAPDRAGAPASGSQPLAKTTLAAPRTTPRNATCAPPAGFAGNVVKLNAELLGGLSADEGPWRTLLAPAGDSLVVREDGGFAAMLGLRAGDRILQANGIALRVPDDVASAIVRPLAANQGVRVVGSRGGTRHELWLANVACAG
ncbi:MAG TPA: type II secretion system protein N [Casimicrobiaceae bacterium]|nr:type II secretion system protein N [Casimicrobiaceae bacterium]